MYSVLYRHFTNSIENYFSMIESRLYKLDGLTHKELKTNIDKVGILNVQRSNKN